MDILEFRSKLKETADGIQYLEAVHSIESLGRNLKKEKGFEIHHVHPRGLGGDLKDPENLLKETREKISKARRGIVFTEEHRKHLSEARKGYKPTEEHKSKCGSSRRGRIAVYNPVSDELRYLKPDQVNSFLKGNEEWVRGSRPASEERKEKVRNFFRGKSNINKGSKILNKNGIRKRVHGEEITKLLEEGWQLGTGLKVSESTRKRMSENKKGKPSWNRGSTGFLHEYIWITDGVHSRRVKDQKVLEEYFQKGWRKGKLGTTTGRIRTIIDGKVRYIIPPRELE